MKNKRNKNWRRKKNFFKGLRKIKLFGNNNFFLENPKKAKIIAKSGFSCGCYLCKPNKNIKKRNLKSNKADFGKEIFYYFSENH